MSTTEITDTRELPPGTTGEANNIVNMRIWPAVVLVVAFWVFLYANHEMESAQAPRFFSRMIAYLVALVAFFSWWLSRSQIRWRDRLLAIAVPIAFGAITLPFLDKSINWFGLLLNSLPIVMTVWTGWLVIARSFTARAQRLGFCVVMLLPFIYGSLLRFDGLRAQQSADMSWRWTPTEERLFLASHEAGAKDAAKPAMSVKPWTLQSGDCPEFRGPNRDGVLTGVMIVANWNEHPPKLLWTKRVGPGWSGMIVVDGHVVTQEQRDAVETVVCYDAATGDELWAHNDAKRFEESLAGAGPRGTPTFASGRIYSLGGLGTLNCLTPQTGEAIWSHDVIKDADVAAGDLPVWGYSVSPLVIDGLVIVFAGGTSDKSILAYRAADGTLAWTAPGGKQSYSSPQLATLNGQKQIAMHDTGATRVLTVADGKEV
jgi:outer membrane protein assembly factor BamB